MDRYREILVEIQERLRVLTISQRIAIGLCAAMIGFSLLWLMQWSSTPDLVPLLDHEFSFTELDGAEAALESRGIRYHTRGTRLFVRASDRYNALRLLHSANALPEGSLFDMASVVAEQNPFLAPEARQFAQNYAIGNELAKIIATAPFVKQASVIVNPKAKRRLGGQADDPTASVAVTLVSGQELTETMVDGFAKLVSGAVAGLKPHNVYITDTGTGRSYHVPLPEDVASFDIFNTEKKREAHLLSKILGALAYIPGVRVAVSVELDASKRVTQKLKHDAAQPKLEQSQTSEQGVASGAAEPGVQANLGQELTAGTPGATSVREETTVENFEPQLSETETVEQIPLTIKSVSAAIGIPRSFVAGIFRARFPNSAGISDDDAEFVKLRDEQIAKVKSSVERIVMAKGPQDVEVIVYPDLEWSADGAVMSHSPVDVRSFASSADSWEPIGLLRGYGPQAGLVLLALAGMVMMVRMARGIPPSTRRPTSRPVPKDAGTEPDEPLLVPGSTPVGKATVSESLLVGREIDDQTLRYQELGEEVSKLVESDPEGAAELIRRWMAEI